MTVWCWVVLGSAAWLAVAVGGGIALGKYLASRGAP